MTAGVMEGPLVSTAWLAQRLDDPKVVVLDGSWFMPGTPRFPRAEFLEGHIPGAQVFGIDEICDRSSPLPHMLPDPPTFTATARALGVNDDSTVVAYDSVGLFSAARVWWTFRAMGHEQVYVLDGGLPRWNAEGRPVQRGEPAAPTPGAFTARLRPELVRGFDDMLALVTSRRGQIVDARGAARFRGEAPEPRPGLRSGHMPGALNLPFDQLVTDGALAAPKAIAAAFTAAGADVTKPIVATCGSGLTASILALGLARIGAPEAAIYDGSWSEWGGRDEAPVETG